MKTKPFFKKYYLVIIYLVAALALNALMYVSFKNTDAIILLGGVSFIICYTVTLFVNYDFFKPECSKPKHLKPERYIHVKDHNPHKTHTDYYILDTHTSKVILQFFNNDMSIEEIKRGELIANFLNENEQ